MVPKPISDDQNHFPTHKTQGWQVLQIYLQKNIGTCDRKALGHTSFKVWLRLDKNSNTI